MHPGATFYKPEWGEEHPYAGYDPAAAQELLDEMGLTERDSDGLSPDVPMARHALLIIEYPTSMTSTSVTVHELVKEYWEDIGLKVLSEAGGSTRWRSSAMEAGEHEILSEAEIFRKELREYNISPETLRWGSKWHLWLAAEQAIEDGRTEAGRIRRRQAPRGGAAAEDQGPVRAPGAAVQLGIRVRQEYLEVSEKIFDFYAEELLIIGTVGLAPSVYIANDQSREHHQGRLFDSWKPGRGRASLWASSCSSRTKGFRVC